MSTLAAFARRVIHVISGCGASSGMNSGTLRWGPMVIPYRTGATFQAWLSPMVTRPFRKSGGKTRMLAPLPTT